VASDVIEGRVSPVAAREQYGVVLAGVENECTIDEGATLRLRAQMKAQRADAGSMIDRGEGYEKMLRGECAPRMRKEA
jgi:N-methylhydantoinase B